VASVWLLSYHLKPQAQDLASPGLAWMYGALMGPGYLAVDLFFLLSGFLLSWNYARSFSGPFSWTTTWRFWLARLARIYPVHLLTLLLLVPGAFIMSAAGLQSAPDRFSSPAFVTHLLMMQGWPPGLYDRPTWNTPAWAVSIEWLACLCFPLLMRWPPQWRPGRWLLPLLGAVMVALPTLMYVTGRLYGFGYYDQYVRIATEFLAGMLLYRAYARGLLSGWRWERIVPWCVVGVVVGGAAFYSAGRVDFAYVLALFFVPVLAGLTVPHLALTRVLSTRWMMHWGRRSYSLNMTHNLWFMALKATLPSEAYSDAHPAVRAGLWLLYVVPCFPLADLTYRFVEEPGRRWIKSLIGPDTRTDTRRPKAGSGL
jgi:peptidoglycan/LPS O-acetylase OafA/YrhL